MITCSSPWFRVSVLLLVEVAFVLLASRVAVGNPNATTREGALLTIARIDDLTKWMAALETAVLGGLGYLVFGTETPLILRITLTQRMILTVAGINIGIALLTSGWIFTSLGSIGVRLHGLPPNPVQSAEYDVAEWPIYSSRRQWKAYKLGYLITCKHWFWGLGLAAVAVFIVALLYHPPLPPEPRSLRLTFQ